ncbi:MAG: hypothetical protein ABI192_18420 [Bradyrhizobium sp.]
MRKFILITAMVLASATAHAGDPRSLSLAGDEPAKIIETKPVETNAAETKAAEITAAEAPQYVVRPSVVDTNAAQPAAQCQPGPATAEAPKTAPKDFATANRPKRRRPSTQSRVVAELHRHGIYW